MADYKSYLSNALFREQQTVTYRLLARALKVHVNQAKEMLYAFSTSDSTKETSAIKATYLICGLVPAEASAKGKVLKVDEDEVMDSSPFESTAQINIEGTATPTLPKTAIVLVGDAELEEAKSRFTAIKSIHIYSLGLEVIRDSVPLNKVSEVLREKYSSGDPLADQKRYGGIVNDSVNYRAGKGGRPPPPKITAKTAVKTPAKTATTETTMRLTNPAASTTVEEKPKAEPSNAKAHAKPAQRQKADFFKSFGTKGVVKKEEVKKEEPEATAMDVDEPEDEEKEEEKKEDEEAVKARKAKEEELKEKRRREKEELARIFDNDDEDVMQEINAEDTEMADANDPPPSAQPSEPKTEIKMESPTASTPLPRPQSSHSDSAPTSAQEPKTRKRGRRLVTKSVTSKDKRGYLVTTEEKVWESYSEDEEEEKKPKKTFASAPAKKPVKGGKKEGNIMSFFQKKGS